MPVQKSALRGSQMIHKHDCQHVTPKLVEEVQACEGDASAQINAKSNKQEVDSFPFVAQMAWPKKKAKARANICVCLCNM